MTTQDGYTLSLQRIPNGQSGATTGPNKIPVLLQHGLFMVCVDFTTEVVQVLIVSVITNASKSNEMCVVLFAGWYHMAAQLT